MTHLSSWRPRSVTAPTESHNEIRKSCSRPTTTEISAQSPACAPFVSDTRGWEADDEEGVPVATHTTGNSATSIAGGYVDFDINMEKLLSKWTNARLPRVPDLFIAPNRVKKVYVTPCKGWVNGVSLCHSTLSAAARHFQATIFRDEVCEFDLTASNIETV